MVFLETIKLFYLLFAEQTSEKYGFLSYKIAKFQFIMYPLDSPRCSDTIRCAIDPSAASSTRLCETQP